MELNNKQATEISKIVSDTIRAQLDDFKKTSNLGELQKSSKKIKEDIEQAKKSDDGVTISLLEAKLVIINKNIGQVLSAHKELKSEMAESNEIIHKKLIKMRSDNVELSKESIAVLKELDRLAEIEALDKRTKLIIKKMENSKFLRFIRRPADVIGPAWQKHIAKSPTLKWMTATKEKFANSTLGMGMRKLNENMGIGTKAMGIFFAGSAAGKFIGLFMKPLSDGLSKSLAKFFPYKNLVDFLLSPAGIAMMMTIVVLFKNFIWNPILKPAWEKMKAIWTDTIEPVLTGISDWINTDIDFTYIIKTLKWIKQSMENTVAGISSTAAKLGEASVDWDAADGFIAKAKVVGNVTGDIISPVVRIAGDLSGYTKFADWLKYKYKKENEQRAATYARELALVNGLSTHSVRTGMNNAAEAKMGVERSFGLDIQKKDQRQQGAIESQQTQFEYIHDKLDKSIDATVVAVSNVNKATVVNMTIPESQLNEPAPGMGEFSLTAGSGTF